MAKLAELGKYFPCETEGIFIPEEDPQTEIYPGEVMEAQWVADKDISIDAAFKVLLEVLRMKEEYPYFVLHYVKVETRKLTFQYSLAPVGGGHNPWPLAWVLVAKLLILLIGILVAYGLALRWSRGYLWTKPLPVGDAVITTKDMRTLKGIANVGIEVDGNYVGKTGSGGSIKITKLLEGIHTFAGEELDGYWKPDTVKQAVIKDQVINVEIPYHPDDEPQPTKGWLEVYTHPISGRVWVGGVDYGLAPIRIELERGDYSITYAYVEGYITPKPDNATIVGGTTPTVRYGYYTLPEGDELWYEKYLRYALIGGGVILGAALIVPELVRAVRKKE